MTTPKIESIAVYLQIDGHLCLAPIAPECATMFVRMLPAFQAGQSDEVRLISMPNDVAKHVGAAGRALGEHFARTAAQKEKQ